ncbi:hydroxyethylthiazole kinase [Anaerocolumna sp. AGMB13020]|uniref:hydroxyethylthiazole kinase n=1 Tax=Anaerocolumna sp. AGMB13020 TaxID=3081750 RepID=UPI002953722E|nr:hydroxyethylthiazole kinase [Anaerocolumna sp. AGMB13020]WOO35702.1 hydroxyethylthiazole kinase [Anaerocolumna sp. AGMB13020]
MVHTIFEGSFRRLRERAPHIHCITNYVTANDCANILLACGAYPVMADFSEEAEEITAGCEALVINLGTINDNRLSAMLRAGKRANALLHPVLLDPVGVGASAYRLEAAFRLLKEIDFSVIRGNASEIKTLYKGSGSSKGVDAAKEDSRMENNPEEACKAARELAGRTGAVIVQTGETDILAEKEKVFYLGNGHASMCKIAGTGCMLSAVIGAFNAVYPEEPLRAAIAGTAAMGISGEIAFARMLERKEGTASLKIHLMDCISNMEEELLKERILLTEDLKGYREWTS